MHEFLWALAIGAALRAADTRVSRPMRFAHTACVSILVLHRINFGHNKALLDASKPLMEYAWFVHEIRNRLKQQMEIKTAVDTAIEDMPDTFALRSFLTLYKLEIGTMLLTEFDAVEHDEIVFNEGKQEGLSEGKAEALINMMQKLRLTFEQAAEILNISSEQYPDYKKVILSMNCNMHAV
jgi:hypothetical protein